MTMPQLAVRARQVCPVCRHPYCITGQGRFWTHGPRTARCRGSQLRPRAAQHAATTVRGTDNHQEGTDRQWNSSRLPGSNGSAS